MYRLIRAVLFLFSAETAHHLVLGVLSWVSRLPGVCRWLRRDTPVLPVDVAGLRLDTPIGLAAGLDKDAAAVEALFGLGFGAVEIGTVTPRPQPGNPKPRIFRLPAQRALINRLGFNNRGATLGAERLGRLRYKPGALGVNLGKNKDTPIEHAVDDYLACVDQLAKYGDYVVINASSPNTPNLRQLQEPEALTTLLHAVKVRLQHVAPGRPLFLKIAPDLAPEAVEAIVDVAIACGIDGIIATNTTITRPVRDPRADEAGGLSGSPLRPLALEVMRTAYARAAGRLVLVGVGGIMTAADAYERIRAGATFVQLYTGFVYGGPGLVKQLTRELAALLERDGFNSVAEAVGVDVSRGSRTSIPEALRAPAADGAPERV